MTEETGIESIKPANIKSLERDMSTAPFYGVHKIEFEQSYKDFEENMKAMENNKSLPWENFFKTANQLEPKLRNGSLVVVETKKYRCIYDLKPGYESRKFRTNDGDQWDTPFHTWQGIIDILKLWKDTKFNPNLIVEPDRYCINRNFRHVHIFKHKRGYIFSNQFDMVYSQKIMSSTIIL